MPVVEEIQVFWNARMGNLMSVSTGVTSAFNNIGRSAGQSSRQVSLADQQMRAFGTTLRYAFAGTVIFGVTSLIGKLNQLQQQMGLIAAIAGPSGINLARAGGLTGLEDALAEKAVAARTNLGELNDATINFLSTVQGADPGEIPEIIANIGMAAKLSQTPTEDLTKAVTTLNIAAGRQNNLKTINALLREWFHLISQAPGGIAAAPQIAQQLGPLAAVGRAGQLSPEQLFSFALGSLRFGATPSTALRGGQYFLQSLFQPTKGQGEMLAGLGLTPAHLQQVGGAQFTLEFLRKIAAMGTVPTRAQARQFGAFTDLATATDTEAGLAPNELIPGLTPQQQKVLRGLGRIHGIRTAVVLMSQLFKPGAGGQVAPLEDLLKTFDQLEKGVGPDARELVKAAERYRQQTPLQAAAVALDTLRLTVARDAQAVVNPVARGVAGAAQGITKDTGTRHAAELGLAAFAAALGVRSGIRGVGRFFGMGGKAIVTAQALSAAQGGDQVVGHSPLNPLFVVVVGQVFGGGGGGGFSIPPVIATGGRFGKFGGAARAGGWIGLALLLSQMAAPNAPKNWQDYSWTDMYNEFRHPTRMNIFGWHPFGGGGGRDPKSVMMPRFGTAFDAANKKLLRDWTGIAMSGFYPAGTHPQPTTFNEIFGGDVGSLLNRSRRQFQQRSIKFEDLNIQLEFIQKGIKTRKRVHTPVVAHAGGSVPSSRGRRGKTVKLTVDHTPQSNY